MEELRCRIERCNPCLTQRKGEREQEDADGTGERATKSEPFRKQIMLSSTTRQVRSAELQATSKVTSVNSIGMDNEAKLQKAC